MQSSQDTPHEPPGGDGLDQPVKLIRTVEDMAKWQRSEAYHNLLGFINGISTAIQGKRITDQIYVSEQMEKFLAIFAELNKWVDETPPTEQPQRFGNKSFRTWSQKMSSCIFSILQKSLPDEKHRYLKELGVYLAESFGNAVRIDYGTGHELSFLFFLCALFKAEILLEADNVACALRLFNTYLTFVRRLQKTYNMEPAGSQGVWALDDYQFVPFIWGSAQLSLHSPFEPYKFLEEKVIEEYKDAYMYIGSIAYIMQVKKGQFAEHSNQLWSISSVPSWSRINAGLCKMYEKEILAKFPVIQHVYFGKLMSIDPVKLGTAIPNARLGSSQRASAPHPSSVHAMGSMRPPLPPGDAKKAKTPPRSVNANEDELDEKIGEADCEAKKETAAETKL